MSTLYLDRRELELREEGRSLALYRSGQRASTIPMTVLERVVMRGSVAVKSGLIAALADNGIGVLLFGGRHGSRHAMVFGGAPADVTRRVAQYRLYLDPAWRREWAARLVLKKLHAQRRLLVRALERRPDLRYPLSKAINSLQRAEADLVIAAGDASLDSLCGREGAAAAAYFPAYTALFPESLGFAGRNRRPPRDPVNAVLSLGYTLLHFEAAHACFAAGLDPLLGFYHEPAHGRESLAADFIEPLRPRLDEWVWGLFRERELREHHFDRQGDACLLDKQGRQIFYGQYELWVRPARRLLRQAAAQLVRGTLDVPA